MHEWKTYIRLRHLKRIGTDGVDEVASQFFVQYIYGLANAIAASAECKAIALFCVVECHFAYETSHNTWNLPSMYRKAEANTFAYV